MALLLLALAACHPADPASPATGAPWVPDPSGTATGTSTTPVETGPVDSAPPDETDTAPIVPTWPDDPCAGLDVSGSGYAATVQRWVDQDGHAPPAPGQLVVAGSSSIRRWETAFRELSDRGVVQRGFGGAKLTEIAGFAPELITAHAPSAVLVYAGTNDLDGGASPDDVVTAWRCVAQQVWEGTGAVPIVFVAITPTPARWDQWDDALAVHAAIAELAATTPTLELLDPSAAFLATGAPPSADLFDADLLHLNEAGYALWTAELRAGLDALGIPVRAVPAAGALTAPLRVDLGPSNADDGTRATGPDAFGHHWNAWHPVDGDEPILAGERLGGLVDQDGAATGVELVITGGFRNNGLQNGGLVSPDPARLGDLAVSEATQDYVYVDGLDNPGALALVGLDPSARYTLRLFASRDWGDEVRTTRYTVAGASTASATLQTSGQELGAGGYDGNTDTVVTFDGLAPDAWGQLHVDVAIEAGSYAYLALLELTPE